MQAPSPRLEFLDFLRFLAAFAVMLQHTLESKSLAFAAFCTDYFQFGVFGVTLFFLTSGFIIPVSIEKAPSLKAFWINRVYRLFPLYYTSILVSLVLIYLGWIEGSVPSVASLAANAVMLAKFLGQPLVLGLYWTLNLEMVFYLLVTGLFLVGLLRKSTLLAALALVAALLVGVVGTQVLHLFESGWGLCFQLATMFVGTVYYRHMKGQVTGRTWSLVVLGALLVLFAITYFNLYGKDVPDALGTRSFWPVTNAFLLAYLLFTGCFLLRRLSYPKPFLFLGLISYSLYLVQATVLALVLPQIENVYLSTVVGLGATILVSYFTYTFIEKPFVQIGRKRARNAPVSVPR
ncbi:acyltransferase family protein [Rufibacter glacialis]|uniref:Acyltransferase n=1 Tax=Rufibacter glacialis TaxID=1259555 RepID=A0A5M8QI21_9BACT|nr:acyltransferase [Rufibacter glacialis]KAA6434600.1 acyltransferase [Rufibacter glacialis]GGK70860.1 acyltransferase [Rufibacter glacialis]